jgi:hypothetical protein
MHRFSESIGTIAGALSKRCERSGTAGPNSKFTLSNSGTPKVQNTKPRTKSRDRAD